MDAPVSGGVERAKKQSLMIMFGGCKRKFNANKNYFHYLEIQNMLDLLVPGML